MLTFFRPQQLPRTTKAGLVLASDQKEGPGTSHTATENIYTAGTLEPWGRSALLQGPVLGQLGESGGSGWGGGGGPGASAECWSSKDGAKDNDHYELTVTHLLFPLSQKSCLPLTLILMKGQHTHCEHQTRKMVYTAMREQRINRNLYSTNAHVCVNQLEKRHWLLLFLYR